ncbi:dihydrodipicolinate reductase [Halorubrum californiense DSM 19288]|uniref:4-hydroxy-tetrahydrodipicolinate reductase n=1 Tax=Halorubrum californiense DSM 19288 TaxID=1227465 RepID=M0EMN1_9EURY|nr:MULTISPECIES: 4-hydroxy-tetrahydrodipicolinate reductase [Halorubrum]ELZ48157.1 dihydrodipicolinate reductase [Halorubrum californiense DSM 19288]TKX72569.1 4-hydroxy-tetrahydrodipicolinate reductase [Halorubrum sp. GN11GM_10-3_MGM]
MSDSGDPTAADLRIAVTGAGGRMGREVIEAAADREDVTVAVAVNRTATDPVAGVAVEDAADLDNLLASEEPDVLVDFTGPDSAVAYAETCADAGVPLVTGTTGFTESQVDDLRAASESVPVLKASNFARGVAALRRAVREAAAALPGYDVELTETHHNAKRDAPSGTAKSILDDVEEVRGDLDERVHGREGDAPRESTEIGVHARRAGDVTGEHEVLLAGNRETLELTHRAGDRGVFAEGALDAAAWLAASDPGWYGFGDVLDAGEE